jgi:hypothetical protein
VRSRAARAPTWQPCPRCGSVRLRYEAPSAGVHTAGDRFSLMLLGACLAGLCLLIATLFPARVGMSVFCLCLPFLLAALVFPFVGIPPTAGEGHCLDCDYRWETAPAPPRGA